MFDATVLEGGRAGATRFDGSRGVMASEGSGVEHQQRCPTISTSSSAFFGACLVDDDAQGAALFGDVGSDVAGAKPPGERAPEDLHPALVSAAAAGVFVDELDVVRAGDRAATEAQARAQSEDDPSAKTRASADSKLHPLAPAQRPRFLDAGLPFGAGVSERGSCR